MSAGGITTRCDDDSWAIIEEEGVKYSASERGVQWIDTNSVFITLIHQPSSGDVTTITVSVGGGIDAAKANYDMGNLSHPSVFYVGDDIEWVQNTIESQISTNRMEELVAQAEHFQKRIRLELDELDRN